MMQWNKFCVLENKAGRLSEVTEFWRKHKSTSEPVAANTSDFGILRLIVNNNDKAKEALKQHGFTVGKTDVVAVEVGDHPGGLHRILEVLHKANVNVEYMYAFVQQSGNNAVIIFRFDNLDEAVKVLTENGIKVIEGKTLYGM
jgi:hypothetical protein